MEEFLLKVWAALVFLATAAVAVLGFAMMAVVFAFFFWAFL